MTQSLGGSKKSISLFPDEGLDMLLYAKAMLDQQQKEKPATMIQLAKTIHTACIERVSAREYVNQLKGLMNVPLKPDPAIYSQHTKSNVWNETNEVCRLWIHLLKLKQAQSTLLETIDTDQIKTLLCQTFWYAFFFYPNENTTLTASCVSLTPKYGIPALTSLLKALSQTYNDVYDICGSRLISWCRVYMQHKPEILDIIFKKSEWLKKGSLFLSYCYYVEDNTHAEEEFKNQAQCLSPDTCQILALNAAQQTGMVQNKQGLAITDKTNSADNLDHIQWLSPSHIPDVSPQLNNASLKDFVQTLSHPYLFMGLSHVTSLKKQCLLDKATQLNQQETFEAMCITCIKLATPYIKATTGPKTNHPLLPANHAPNSLKQLYPVLVDALFDEDRGMPPQTLLELLSYLSVWPSKMPASLLARLSKHCWSEPFEKPMINLGFENPDLFKNMVCLPDIASSLSEQHAKPSSVLGQLVVSACRQFSLEQCQSFLEHYFKKTLDTQKNNYLMAFVIESLNKLSKKPRTIATSDTWYQLSNKVIDACDAINTPHQIVNLRDTYFRTVIMRYLQQLRTLAIRQSQPLKEPAEVEGSLQSSS